jgi:Pin2-interacting protein X1
VENQRTGHDAFQGLLGRLNGKSDAEAERERKEEKDRETTRALQGRYNFIQFVKGGLLVQDKITLPSRDTLKPLQTLKDQSREEREGLEHTLAEDAPSTDSRGDHKPKKSSKRKRQQEGEDKGKSLLSETESAVVEPKEERKGSKDESQSSEKKKINKKSKRKAVSGGIQPVEENKEAVDRNPSTDPGETSYTPKQVASESDGTKSGSESGAQSRQLEIRHAIRNRHIRQKKMAMMDSKALDEVSPYRGTSNSWH